MPQENESSNQDDPLLLKDEDTQSNGISTEPSSSLSSESSGAAQQNISKVPFSLSIEATEQNLAIKKPYVIVIEPSGIVNLKFTKERIQEVDGVRVLDEVSKQDKETVQIFDRD